MYSIGIDLGGTNIAAALVSPEGDILERTSIPTPNQLGPQLPQQVTAAMAQAVFQVVEGGNFDLAQASSIGIGSPGTIDPTTQTIGRWSNLDFVNVPLGQLFIQALQALYPQLSSLPQVYLENDANAAALGEFFAGAGKEGDSLVAITLGTGIGGGAIFRGKLFTGFNYAGMEVGHLVIHQGGNRCSCGREGCFEAYASATALIRHTKASMEAHKDSKLWQVSPTLEQVNGRTVFDAALLGDQTAQAVIDHYITYLASGVTSLINVFQPEILCIGGGIAAQKEVLMAPLQAIVDREDYARSIPHRTKIILAQLGNDAGIIGAAMLAEYQ